MAKKLTRKQAIELNCKNCIYDPGVEGTWRQQTTECTETNCALYRFRPVSKGGKRVAKTGAF